MTHTHGNPASLSPSASAPTERQRPVTAGGASAAAATPAPAAPPAPLVAHEALHSRFVQRIHRRYGDALALLPPGVPDRDTLRATYAALRARGLDAGAALRVLRQLVMERLAVLDCDGGAPVQDITLAVSRLAEVTLDLACIDAFAQLDARHGAPLKPDGERCNFWIVGMGKLGARELNVSSDIDLIYLYECDGDTGGRPQPDGTPSGAGATTFQEYFSRAARLLHTLIGDVTEHGFVFRVDLALRPNGNSGPIVCSLDALEEYFVVQGREWERFAWMKSRVVAPRASIVNGSARRLRDIVLPFVFRRYLDYGVFESLRVLHRQIRDHANRRSAGRPERANDVKLGRGGIREIEFTVQLLQVVRGGTFPELRTRNTLGALQRVAAAGLMAPDIARQLTEAYIFLRRVEHRIQYLDDAQTHVLPTAEADLAWIARTMGSPDLPAFLAELAHHRAIVEREFDILLGGAAQPATDPATHGSPPADIAQSCDDIGALIELLADDPPELARRIGLWRDHPRVQALRPDTRARLMRLMQRSVEWLHTDGPHQGVTAAGLLRFIDWIETLLRRESYLALLLERPVVHERLLRLLGVARWPARYLMQHPGVIDELTSETLLGGRFDAAAFRQDLCQRLASLQSTGEDNEEELLDLLRRAMHAETFRTLARDLDNRLTVEQVADDLSSLADAVLDIATRWCWRRYLPRARHLGWEGADDEDISRRFAVIAYGKLGGLELGYGSDLDVVFVYQDPSERAGEIYAGLVRKLITSLTVKTGEGDLYEIDTALRPNGNSGLLCTTLAAYDDYQLQRGSNTAWVWEHQAMTRARCAFGSEALRAHFERIRCAVLTAPRDPAALAHEITAMRERMRRAHPVRPGRFDLKHSPGGMIDIEFATQYLVLLHSRHYPAMTENRGNIRLLERADDLGILPPGIGHAAAAAYRELRRLQHRARLNEETPDLPADTPPPEAQAGMALWEGVFGASSSARSVP